MLPGEAFSTALTLLDDMNERQLTTLIQAAVEHKRYLQNRQGRVVLATLETDSRVRIKTEGIKPKYIAGQRGTVQKIEGSKVHVKLDHGPQGKFRTGVVICPPAILEVI